MVLTQQPRADTRVVDCHELIVVVRLLCVLSVVHVAQVVLLALEEDHGEAVQRQSAAYIIVEHPRAEVEPLVVLAGLCKLALLFGELAHLEVDVCLLHEVTLLDARLRLHDQVLGGLARRM